MARNEDLAWFGEHWGSLGNDLWPKAPHEPYYWKACTGCEQVFMPGDQGIVTLYTTPHEYYHRICWSWPSLTLNDVDEFGPPTDG